MRPTIIVIAVLLCAGCGSGGGNANANANPNPNPNPPANTGSANELGSRALPGYTARVLSVAPITPGGSLAVEIQMTPDSGQTAPTLVESAMGGEEPVVWVAALPKPGTVNAWTWSGTLPADLTGQRVWVRVSDAEGNISQSGGQDFALGQKTN